MFATRRMTGLLVSTGCSAVAMARCDDDSLEKATPAQQAQQESQAPQAKHAQARHLVVGVGAIAAGAGLLARKSPGAASTFFGKAFGLGGLALAGSALVSSAEGGEEDDVEN